MRHPRVVPFRAGLYVAIALSGFAAVYVLKEWLPHLWAARVPPPSGRPDDDKTSPGPASQQDQPEIDARQTDEAPPLTDPDHSPSTGAPTPPTGQSKILPPLLTHSLPPPVPSRHTLSGSPFVINIDTVPSPTSTGSFHPSSDDTEDEIDSQTNTSDTLTDSFLDVLSPPPTHVISRRRSMRAHDPFAASHISFTELGSLVSPPEDT